MGLGYRGAYDDLPHESQAFVQEMVAEVHYRDGKKHDDGSMGTIGCSPKQLRDLLAYAIISTKQDAQ